MLRGTADARRGQVGAPRRASRVAGTLHETAAFAVQGGFASVPWEDDLIVPVHWIAPHPDTPERRLLMAVLEDALWTIRKGVPIRHEPLAVAQARAWIASTATSWLCDFERICVELGLEPEPIRRAVLQGKAGERYHFGYRHAAGLRGAA
jgi:hypothetical protein